MGRLRRLAAVLGCLLPLSLLPVSDVATAPRATPATTTQVYLPLVVSQRTVRRVNAPYFDVADIGQSKFDETVIFWFGRVTPAQNYADVRVAYNDVELYVHMAIFDRRLWYDESPSVGDLTQWDAVTLYLNTTGSSGGAPGTSAYRLIAQLSWWEERAGYQATYRGNASGWEAASVPMTTTAGWRGNAPLDDMDDRGWVMEYRIPFSSLGLAAPPPPGSVWGMALAVHDRDDRAGAPIADERWPETMNGDAPYTWGQLHFGLPVYSPPGASSLQTVTIRQGLNGAAVPDAAIGGTTGNLCPGDDDFIWNVWGNSSFAGAPDFNIQNQSDVSDWPCFAKYYVTFPLSAIPPGKVIVSATLTLHHWGNSGPFDQVESSYVHVMTVGADWDESTLAWNNAPLAVENVSQAWVPKVGSCDWPCVPRTWDVSRAVAQAHADGRPLRLALYSSDGAYQSGKFFTASDTGDWNAEGRPTLQVTFGDP